MLFQLPTEPAGVVLTKRNRDAIKIVMFISQGFSDVEQHYLNTEREALAILQALEESRWLAVGSPLPVIVYTDHVALLSVLRGEGTKGSGAGHHRGQISS